MKKEYEQFITASIFGLAVVVIFMLAMGWLIDKDNCNKKGGAFIHDTCFKREAIL
jgi:hypothetical protein